MTDNKIRTELNDRLERGSPEPVEQQTQQNQASAKAPSERRTAPGRIPLFRR
jgi:hypothetical protein